MKKIILEFELKRGVINADDLEEEVKVIHDHCLELVTLCGINQFSGC